jgi:hypothetical protein
MIDARRISIGLGLTAGAIAVAALAGSSLAYADVLDCGADACGTATLIGPFDFTTASIPADDYSSIGSFVLGADGQADATGYVITSGGDVPGVDISSADFPGLAGETLLYTDVGGVIGAPVELLPFDLPL